MSCPTVFHPHFYEETSTILPLKLVYSNDLFTLAVCIHVNVNVTVKV